jgi:hypothetical protein
MEDAMIITEVVEEREPSILMETTSDDFSNATEFTKEIEKSNEELLKHNKIPDRNIAKLISSTEISIDLALAAQAKQLSHKMLKLESFLSKIEDTLFSDDTIAELDKGDLMNLYTNTRLMKTDSFRMLKDIKKEIDFDKLEVSIMALNAKDDMNTVDEDSNVNDILDKLMKNEGFLDLAINAQLNEVENE